jgi:5-methylcytosine-specific restriction endonuclease McrA
MPKLIGDKPMTGAEISKRWRENNPERAKEVQAKYKEKHPNAPKESSKRFYHKNAESEKARSNKWREENRERSREIQRKSWHKNREINILRRKKWVEKNKGRIAEGEHRRRALEKNCETYTILSKEIRSLRSSACSVCQSVSSIEMDHIIPLSRGGRHSIGNLQPLCKSCNLSKSSKFMSEWKKIKGE